MPSQLKCTPEECARRWKRGHVDRQTSSDGRKRFVVEECGRLDNSSSVACVIEFDGPIESGLISTVRRESRG
jgi:hypothetical protein